MSELLFCGLPVEVWAIAAFVVLIGACVAGWSKDTGGVAIGLLVMLGGTALAAAAWLTVQRGAWWL